jgi:5-methylcytosine-specific restriction endonuclease McrA
MHVQVFKYRIVQEIPLSELQNDLFFNHHRLGVFARFGTKCVSCGKLGTRLIQGVQKSGSLHWDVYTDDLYPITVDHIRPKSKGGSDDWKNKQPMCTGCNTRKGNKIHGSVAQLVE